MLAGAPFDYNPLLVFLSSSLALFTALNIILEEKMRGFFSNFSFLKKKM